jgi:MerR family transcriptional regulator/heat shock protein HspR
MMLKPQKWYKIGEVARRLDIAVETVRMYEREGLLLPEKTASGQRIFNEDDLTWVNCIRRLIKKKGLNIEGIRRMLALMPCWHLRPCTADNFQSCAFALGGVKPCWTMKANLPAPCRNAECRYCNVYRGASKCENMKKLLYQVSLEQRGSQE